MSHEASPSSWSEECCRHGWSATIILTPTANPAMSAIDSLPRLPLASEVPDQPVGDFFLDPTLCLTISVVARGSNVLKPTSASLALENVEIVP